MSDHIIRTKFTPGYLKTGKKNTINTAIFRHVQIKLVATSWNDFQKPVLRKWQFSESNNSPSLINGCRKRSPRNVPILEVEQSDQKKIRSGEL